MQLRKSTKQATQRSIEHAKLQAEKKNQRKQKRAQSKNTVEKVINIFSEYIFYCLVKLIILCYNIYFQKSDKSNACDPKCSKWCCLAGAAFQEICTVPDLVEFETEPNRATDFMATFSTDCSSINESSVMRVVAKCLNDDSEFDNLLNETGASCKSGNFSFNTNDSQLSVERIILVGTPAVKRTRKPAVHSMSELFSRSMRLEDFA